MEDKKYSGLVTMRSLTRKLNEGESRLFDMRCPKCNFEGLIFLWDQREKKYVGKGRCANPSCRHGN